MCAVNYNSPLFTIFSCILGFKFLFFIVYCRLITKQKHQQQQQQQIWTCIKVYSYMTTSHSCRGVKGGHWASNPYTSLARETAPARKRHPQLQQQQQHTARTLGTVLGWRRRTHFQPDICRLPAAVETWHRNRCLRRDQAPQCDAGCPRQLASDANPTHLKATATTKMKRKSERRRSESRKKHCAAPASSGAAPNCDVYIEITGKRAPRGWTRSTWTRVGRRTVCADALGQQCRALNRQGGCRGVLLFSSSPPSPSFDLIWRHRLSLLSRTHFAYYFVYLFSRGLPLHRACTVQTPLSQSVPPPCAVYFTVINDVTP